MSVHLYTKTTEALSVDTLLAQFATSLTERGMSDNTVKAYVGDVRAWMHRSETRATPYQYVMHLREEGTAPATIRRKVASIVKFLTWTGFMDQVEQFKEIKLPPIPPRKSHPMEGGIKSIHRLIDASTQLRQRRLIALCGLCGLRVNEAVTVKVEDFHFAPPTEPDDDGMWWLTVTGKGMKTRQVPVTWKTIGILKLDGMEPEQQVVPMTVGGAAQYIRRLGKRLDIDLSSHDLRHTYGTAVYRKTRDLRAVQELLGHASSSTTEGYTRIAEETKAAAAVATIDDEPMTGEPDDRPTRPAAKRRPIPAAKPAPDPTSDDGESDDDDPYADAH